jgi:hypothetical protein
MSNLRNITNGFLLFLLLSPVLSIISVVFLDLGNVTIYLRIFAVIFGIIFFILKKGLKIPQMAYFILAFFIFQFIWNIELGMIAEMGLIKMLLKSHPFAIFFIIIIIYNTSFKDKFIRKSIFIIKITVIIAAVVSILQVFDIRFLNAEEYYSLDKEIKSYDTGIYTYRRASIFGFIDPNAIGLAFIPLFSVLIGYMLLKKEKNLWLYLFLGGIVAFLTNSRYVMVGFVIVIFQILATYKVRTTGFVRFTFIALISFFFIYQVLYFSGYSMQKWFNTRLFAEGSITETTRYKAIGNFLIFFPRTPLLGTGEQSKEILEASNQVGSTQIHVGYLSHLVMYGIVGCFFLFGFWYLLVKKMHKTAKITNYWGSYYAFLTFLWSFATMSQSSIFYYGLIFALVFDKYYIEKYYFTKQIAFNNKTLNSHTDFNNILDRSRIIN